MQNTTSTSDHNLQVLNRTTATGYPARPVKVLQFGEGNFLRAFADWMIDLMNERTDFNGAVQVVQPIATGLAHVLQEQEGLYHVILNGIENGKPARTIRRVSSVTAALNPFSDFAAFLTLAENPDLKFILSNTTEAGITFNAADNDPTKLALTFPGKLTQLLYHRYKYFGGSADSVLTIMPCELIDRNGEALREAILQYARQWSLDAGFINWIENDTIFCNTLVDRIVPGFPRDTINEIRKEIGFNDQLVVMAESFHLWVIEPCDASQKQRLTENFPAAQAGLHVKVVDDLQPYRTRKVRILNGAHTAMVPVAYLRGLETVREAVEDPDTGDFIRKTIAEEIIPTLDLPKHELDAFAAAVIERFQNPFIRHELLSIALNSVSKFRVRVLPSLLTYVERKGSLPQRLLFSLAALLRFYKGEWNGKAIPLNDDKEIIEVFQNAWREPDPVSALLSNTTLWHTDLTQINGLVESVQKHLQTIESRQKSINGNSRDHGTGA